MLLASQKKNGANMKRLIMVLLLCHLGYGQSKDSIISACPDIIVKDNGRYMMNGQKLGMLKMNSILRENEHAYPHMRKVRALKTIGLAVVGVGGAIQLVSLANADGNFTPMQFIGLGVMGVGLGIGLSSNGQLNLALKAFNGSKCSNQN